MSDLEPSGTDAAPARGRMGRGLSTAILGFAVLGAIFALYVMGLAACKPGPASKGDLAGLAHGAMSKLQPALSGSSYPDVPFVDGAGKQVRFSDFKGRVVVLNLWATWCAPCVKEMPTLAALQQSFKDRPVTVVALSTDSNGQVDKAKAFIAAHPPLGFYHDANLAVTSAIQPRVQGFPTTLVYDEEGRLRGSVQGDADWSSPEAKAVISALLP